MPEHWIRRQTLANEERFVTPELKAREGIDGLVDLDGGLGASSRYQPGERVLIEEGALCAQVGLFQTKVDAERVIILLKLLGRDVRAIVNANALRRAET